MKFECPHCGKATISVNDKLRLDPRHKIKCKECGGYINIPYFVMLIFAVIIFSVGYVMKINLAFDWLYVIFTLTGIGVIYELIVVFCVPIIKKWLVRFGFRMEIKYIEDGVIWR